MAPCVFISDPVVFKILQLRLGGSLWNRDTDFWGPISMKTKATRSLACFNQTIFRQLSAERRAQPDCDPPCCVLQRGGGHRVTGDGRQRSEASHCRQNPRHPQKLCQQGEKNQTQKPFDLNRFLPFFCLFCSHSSPYYSAGILHKQWHLPRGLEWVGVLREPAGTAGSLNHPP